jgi:hypothetical protein
VYKPLEGPPSLHTWDREPVVITLSSTLIGGDGGDGQSKFASSHCALRDRRSVWMRDGCESLRGFLHGIKWTVLHGHVDYFFKQPSLRGRPNTRTNKPWHSEQSQPLVYHAWGPTCLNRNSLDQHLVESPITHYTWGSVTTLHDFGGVLGWPLDTSFFWALTIPRSRALGSCVKWPSNLANLSLLSWFLWEELAL